VAADFNQFTTMDIFLNNYWIHHMKLKRFYLALVIAIFYLASNLEVTAQFMGGGGGMRSTGRSGASSRGTSRTYPSNGMIGEAMISSDTETRRLIVITDEETSKHISQVITNLDRPKPQVLIKVVFLEVTHNDGSDIGVEGQYKHSINNNTSGQVNSLFGIAAQTSGGFYKVLSDDFEIAMRAIATAGKTEVLSRPSVIARNNQQATITVGQELPFITSSQITAMGQTVNTVQYQDIGIILSVTPFISSDGLVEMIIAPEISTLTDQTVQISDTVNAPVIAKRSAETVVVTPNGQPVIIGGLMETKKTDAVKKIPLLGDIPLLGMAFRRKEVQNTKTELIIILTPRIIPRPDQVAAMTEHERTNSQITPSSFSEEQINRFIDGLPVKKDTVEVPETTTKKKTNKTSTKTASAKKSSAATASSSAKGAETLH